jgi:SHS2 domain-containing protein
MPKNYKYLEHMADVEYVAYGKSLEECFKNALMAMFDTISYINKVEISKSKKVTIVVKDKARNTEDLLWYALQDTLSILDSKSLFAYKVAGIKITQDKGSYKINASVYAKDRLDAHTKLDVKGVARYNLKIKETAKGFEGNVVLDV